MQKTISIKSLVLDPKNPRHIPIEAQEQIIEYLIENENIKELAKDIAEKRLTNPLDLVGITEENGKKIVLEGNRRVCALKLILKPELSPKKHQAFFQKLKQKIDQPIKAITVYPFNSREEATIWLATLHSKSSKISRKSWSTEQQTRFEHSIDGKPENAAALTILEFSLANSLIHPDQSQKVITTITRMLSSPEVRDAFGILTGVRERNIQINIQTSEFIEILKQYFSDVDKPEHNIGSRSNKKDRLNYIQHLTELGKIPSSRQLTATSLMPGMPSTPVVQSSPKPVAPKAQRVPSRPKVGMLIDYDLSIPVSKIQDIYLELKTKLNVAESPYAVAALLRALIEQSCDYFLIKNKQRSILFHDGGKTENVTEGVNLRTKILGIAQSLEKDNLLENKELSTLTNECQSKKEGVGTLNLLNGILHNYAHNITSEQIIAAHNNLKPFIIAIWKNIAGQMENNVL